MVRASVLSAALFLAGGAIPFLGTIVILFTPAPIVNYAVGRPGAVWRTIGAVLLAAAGVLAAGGAYALLAYAVTFGLATTLICCMLEYEARFETIVAVTTATVLLAGSVAALLATGSPAAIVSEVREGLSAGIARSEEMYKLLGMSGGVEAETKAKLVDMIVELTPALVGITTAFAVLINLSLFWRTAGKQRLPYKLFGDMVRWSTPQWLIWVFIATGFALFIPLAPARTAALDGFICVAAVYFCQGLAVIAFYLKMLSMPAPWRGVIYFVAAAQPLLAALVSGVGVFDLWVDFRRLRPPGQEAGTFSDLL